MQNLLSENQKNSLFRLLSDDDVSTLDLVKQQILNQGHSAVPHLEGWLKETQGSPAEAHIKDILKRLKQTQCHQQFLEFCARTRIFGDTDLEDACFLLASTEYSATDMTVYRTMLDDIAEQVKSQIGGQGSPSEIRALSQVLHEKFMFRGNRENYFDAENTYFNRVLERRVGVPITLSFLYGFVGRRLGLDIHGIALPGHFIIRWESQFYDPFHQGRLLDETACKQIVESRGQEFHRDQLHPATPHQMLTRMLMNLNRVYELEEDRERLNRIRQYLRAINA